MRKIKNRLLSILVAFAMVVTLFAGRPVSVSAAETDPNAPVTTKTITPNGDGTYKIRLDITGKVNQTQDVNKANVIFVLDLSGSMTTQRLNAQSNAVKSASQTLLELNTKISGVTDVVEIGLISFASVATTEIQKTTSYSTINSKVSSLSAKTGTAAGTNWEAAMVAANNLSFGDDDPVYIIFLSDGDPTLRLTKNGGNNYGENASHNISGQTVYGSGTSDNNKKNYNMAVNYVNTSISNKTIYSVGCFGDTAEMSNFNTAISGAGYYDASDSDKLNEALSSIAKAIADTLGQSNVHTDDGITGLSNLESKVSGDASGFTYYKNNAAWSDAPEAKYENGKVVWNLSSLGALEDGTTYSVEFDVWPGQEAYDLIADLNNGTVAWDSLSPELQAQIEKNGDVYSLLTNTDLSTTYTYDGVEKTQEFEKGSGSMRLVSSSISVKKFWDNQLDGRQAGEVTLRVMEDNTVQKTFKLNPAVDEHGNLVQDPENGYWYAESDDVYIAPGIIVGQPANGAYSDDQVKELGHDYKVVEDEYNTYYWELKSDVYHPMIINGTLTLLKEDENGTVSFKGKKYTIVTDGEAVLDAYNYRRSNLNLTKVVNDETSGLAPADALFGYSITVTDANAEANGNKIWFSVQDADGNTVSGSDLTTSATAEDGNTGYYYGTSGQAFTVSLKAGWNLRIINLPSTSTYSIKETTMPGGFYFNEVKSTTDTQEIDGQTVSGTIDEPNASYKVTYTNDYEGFFYVYHTSKKGGDEGVIETFPVRGNETFNIYEKAADGYYYGGYYNNYYYKGTVDITTDASAATVASGTGKVYNGQSLGFNKAKATAYPVSGEAMAPVAGQVYYLKEVPTDYLNEKIYNKQKTNDDYAVTSVSALANIDDKNYKEYGFYFNGSKNKVASLASTFTETNNGTTTKHTGKSLFGTTNSGYLVIKPFTSSIKKNGVYTVTPYWVTPDGIEVQSNVTRTITAGNLTGDTFMVE